MQPKVYPNLFKNRYPILKGRDWVKNLSEEDRRIFSEIGRAHSSYGHDGGLANVSKAVRDEKGRFVSGKSNL
jgi:hypothetical protein